MFATVVKLESVREGGWMFPDAMTGCPRLGPSRRGARASALRSADLYFPQSTRVLSAEYCCGSLRHAHCPVSVSSCCRPTRRRTVVSLLPCRNLPLALRLPRWRSSGRFLSMAGWPPCTRTTTAGASSSRRYCCLAPRFFLSSQTSTMKSDDDED